MTRTGGVIGAVNDMLYGREVDEDLEQTVRLAKLAAYTMIEAGTSLGWIGLTLTALHPAIVGAGLLIIGGVTLLAWLRWGQ